MLWLIFTLEAIEWHLKNKAYINVRDNWGDVPLSYTITIYKDKEAALFLLDNKAYLYI